MLEQMLFFQLLSKLMSYENIEFSFLSPPPEDREFWDRVAKTREAADREALEDIAAALRRDTNDFLCVDEIIYILRTRGFNAGLRHDY